MNADVALNELEALAQKLDVEVIYDRLAGDTITGGGLCRLKGRWRVIIDRQTSPSEKVSLLARSLARFEIDDLFVSPGVRQLLERQRR